MNSKQPPFRVILFLLCAQLVLFYAHWVIYVTTVFAFMPGPRASALLWNSLFFLSISLLVTQLIVNKWNSRVADALYTISAAWTGTVQFLSLACMIFWIVAEIIVPLGALPPWRPLGAILFALAFAMSAYAVIRSFRPQYVRYYLKIPKLPPAWRGRKAVLVADVHLGNIRGNGSANKLARMVNAERPDIVFLPGDVFDGPPTDYAWMAAPFRDIKARHGVYFVEGNHEEFRATGPYLDAIRSAEVNVLRNEVVVIDGLQLLGVPYVGSNEPDETRRSLGAISFDPEKPSILLKHAPSAAEAVADAGISLMISGHTHNGQMWPYSFLVRRLFGRAGYGYSRCKSMQVVTTSGYGTWGPPQRWGTRAEVVVIKFS